MKRRASLPRSAKRPRVAVFDSVPDEILEMILTLVDSPVQLFTVVRLVDRRFHDAVLRVLRQNRWVVSILLDRIPAYARLAEMARIAGGPLFAATYPRAGPLMRIIRRTPRRELPQRGPCKCLDPDLLSALRFLQLRVFGLSDVAQLLDAPGLEDLAVAPCPRTDWSALQKLPRLRTLVFTDALPVDLRMVPTTIKKLCIPDFAGGGPLSELGRLTALQSLLLYTDPDHPVGLDLDWIAPLRNLRELVLDFSGDLKVRQFGGQVADALSKLPLELERLELRELCFSEDFLSRIVAPRRRLRRLYLNGCAHWPAYEELPVLPDLEFLLLDVRNGNNWHGQYLPRLNGLPKSTHLREVHLPCGNEEVRLLASIPSIEELVMRPKHELVNLEPLQKLPRLERLIFITAHLLDMRPLKKCRALTRVECIGRLKNYNGYETLKKTFPAGVVRFVPARRDEQEEEEQLVDYWSESSDEEEIDEGMWPGVSL
jgi:hypothetical protein